MSPNKESVLSPLPTTSTTSTPSINEQCQGIPRVPMVFPAHTMKRSAEMQAKRAALKAPKGPAAATPQNTTVTRAGPFPTRTCEHCRSSFHLTKKCYLINNAALEAYIRKYPTEEIKARRRVAEYRRRHTQITTPCPRCEFKDHNDADCFLVNDWNREDFLKRHPEKKAMIEKRMGWWKKQVERQAREAEKEKKHQEWLNDPVAQAKAQEKERKYQEWLNDPIAQEQYAKEEHERAVWSRIKAGKGL